jgi:hypothetical protein
LRRENVIASNNAYDEHYIKYFTGLETVEEIRTFGHTQPHTPSSSLSSSSSSAAAAAAAAVPHFSRLPPNYLTLRHVTYSLLNPPPSPPPTPSLLIDYGHDHPRGSPVEWRSHLGLFLEHHVSSLSSLSLANSYIFLSHSLMPAGHQFSDHVINIVSSSPLTSHWTVQTLRKAYSRHYTPLNLASHTALLLLPYQVSPAYPALFF